MLSSVLLGRGIERVVIDRLIELARDLPCGTIEIGHRPTPRNTPATKFLNSLAEEAAPSGWRARSMLYEEGASMLCRLAPETVSTVSDGGIVSGSGRERSVRMQYIAGQLNTASAVLQAMQSRTLRKRGERPYVAPRTPTEITLTAIWCEVLNVDLVGIHDDFFELGGHSLSATRLASKIHDSFMAKPPLRSFFDRRTIAEMALLIEETLVEQLAQLSDEDIEAMLEKIDE
jgi:acyl carrier protein